MGRLFLEYLEGRVYCCRGCRQHVAAHAALLSRQFHSKGGRCYLFDAAVNLLAGPPEERVMTTGAHVVRDVACTRCLRPLGWIYDYAYEASQRYKEGKVILERAQVVPLLTPCDPPPRGRGAGAFLGGRPSDDSGSDGEGNGAA